MNLIEYGSFKLVTKSRKHRRWFLRNFGEIMNEDNFNKLNSKRLIKKHLKNNKLLSQYKIRLLNLVPSANDLVFLITKIPSLTK